MLFAVCQMVEGCAIKAALTGSDETDFSILASVEVWDVGAVYVMLSASGTVFSGSVVSCSLSVGHSRRHVGGPTNWDIA